MKTYFYDDFNENIDDEDLKVLCRTFKNAIESKTDPAALLKEFLLQSIYILEEIVSKKIAARIKSNESWLQLEDENHTIELFESYIKINSLAHMRNALLAGLYEQGTDAAENKELQKKFVSHAAKDIVESISENWENFGFCEPLDGHGENDKKLDGLMNHIVNAVLLPEKKSDPKRKMNSNPVVGIWTDHEKDVQYVIYDNENKNSKPGFIWIYFLGGEFWEIEISVAKKKFTPIPDSEEFERVFSIYKDEIWNKHGISWYEIDSSDQDNRSTQFDGENQIAIDDRDHIWTANGYLKDGGPFNPDL